MTKEEVFSFCTVNFIDSYNDFKSNALKEIEKNKKII